MIRVLVVDPVRLTGTVVSAVLGRESDVHVVGQVGNPQEALDLVAQCDVLAVNALNGNGIAELTRAVSRANPDARVLAMGLPNIKEVILQYIEAGVAGYVLRDDSVEQLFDTLRAVHRGHAVVSPDIAAALMNRVTQLSNVCQGTAWSESDTFLELTPRERQVLALVQQGLSNQEIAVSLTIELGTVKNHIHNILRKLNVRSRHDAVAYLLMTRSELETVEQLN